MVRNKAEQTKVVNGGTCEVLTHNANKSRNGSTVSISKSSSKDRKQMVFLKCGSYLKIGPQIETKSFKFRSLNGQTSTVRTGSSDQADNDDDDLPLSKAFTKVQSDDAENMTSPKSFENCSKSRNDVSLFKPFQKRLPSLDSDDSSPFKAFQQRQPSFESDDVSPFKDFEKRHSSSDSDGLPPFKFLQKRKQSSDSDDVPLSRIFGNCAQNSIPASSAKNDIIDKHLPNGCLIPTQPIIPLCDVMNKSPGVNGFSEISDEAYPTSSTTPSINHKLNDKNPTCQIQSKSPMSQYSDNDIKTLLGKNGMLVKPLTTFSQLNTTSNTIVGENLSNLFPTTCNTLLHNNDVSCLFPSCGEREISEKSSFISASNLPGNMISNKHPDTSSSNTGFSLTDNKMRSGEVVQSGPSLQLSSQKPDQSLTKNSVNTTTKVVSQPVTYKNMLGVYQEGQDVLARWSDGLYYLGTISKVQDRQYRCYVEFEDSSLFWVHFKDLQQISNDKDDESDYEDDTSDLICCLCRDGQSDPPNEIVLCDKCGHGFHQHCHVPPIDTNVLSGEDVPWQCRTCLFAAVAKRGGADSEGSTAVALREMKQTLPYDITSLTWDKGKKTNTEEIYCYCGGPGDWYLKMVQCFKCQQWFHEACLQCLDNPLLYGDRFFIFVCAVCNSGKEYIKRLPMRWVDVVHLVLYNITITSKVKFCDFHATIIPFFAQNWESLQLGELVQEASTRTQLKDRVIETLQNNRTNLFEAKLKWKKGECKKFNSSEHCRFQCGNEGRKAKKTSWRLRTRSPPTPPTVSLPPHRIIDDKLLTSLDLRHGSALLSDSPTPLKRHGPGDSSPTPCKKAKVFDDVESVGPNSAKMETNESTPTDPDHSYDSGSDRSMKRVRGRPRKDGVATGAKPTNHAPGPAHISRARGRPHSSKSTTQNKLPAPKRPVPSAAPVQRAIVTVDSPAFPISDLCRGVKIEQIARPEGGTRGEEGMKRLMACYFGAAGRIACGEKYKVRGKRVVRGGGKSAHHRGLAGRVEYLIEWQGYTAKQLHESLHRH